MVVAAARVPPRAMFWPDLVRPLLADVTALEASAATLASVAVVLVLSALTEVFKLLVWAFKIPMLVLTADSCVEVTSCCQLGAPGVPLL